MRSWIKMLIVAALGCMLIVVVVTPMVRRSVVAIQMDRATQEIESGDFARAEARLTRYEEWAMYQPAIHQQLLCKQIRSKVRRGKTELALVYAESIRTGQAPSFSETQESGGAFIRNGPDWILGKVISHVTGTTETWDQTIGCKVLLDELWKMEKYDEILKTAGKMLEQDPENTFAKTMIAKVQSHERVSTDSGPARSPAKPVNIHPETGHVVVVTNPSEATPSTNTSVEMIPATPDKPTAEELRAREAVLRTRLKLRRKTLTDARPPTEAERTRDAVQRHYDQLRDQAMKLEAEMSNSTGQKRSSLLDQMRSMKGDMSRCQSDLQRAEAAAKATEDKRKAAITNDPEMKATEKELADIKAELQNL